MNGFGMTAAIVALVWVAVRYLTGRGRKADGRQEPEGSDRRPETEE